MVEIRDIPPNIAGTIEARRSASLGWRRCLCELIDNSIDAEAKEIKITLSKAAGLVISDDGIGIDDILRALTDGETTKKGRHKIGRWGVGLKDAAMWTAVTINVRSVCDGIERTGSMDFSLCAREGKFFGEFDANASGQKPNTVIEMRPLLKDRRLPSKGEAGVLARELSFTYHPFISANKIIRLFLGENEIRLIPFRRPRFDPKTLTEFDGEVSGKSFSVVAGVVAEGEENSKPGFHLVFSDRVITDAKTDRASGQYAIGRFFGEIRLGPGWVLERNKDNVFEGRLLDELYDIVLSRCEEVLRISDTQGEDVESQAVESELNRWLAQSTGLDPTGILIGEEKRPGPHAEEGTVTPKATGRRRQEAANVLDMPEKDVRQRRGKNSDKKPKGYVVKFDRLQADVVGDTKVSNPIVVLVNSEHPWVRTHRKDLSAMKVLTSSLIATHTSQAEQWQSNFRAELSKLLSDPITFRQIRFRQIRAAEVA